ncbi:MAG: hypothetical protein LBR51_06010 [Bacteroidales bacterium]|jgi:cytochrome c peroxidase|nr:hypothetical protein [Bacteroidales bacterium]
MRKKDSCSFEIFILLIFFLFASCHREEEGGFEATPYPLNIPPFFPTKLNIPENNPLTVEGIALGEQLFHDKHLCGYTGNIPDSLMSCATCHARAYAYDIGMSSPRLQGGHVKGRGEKYTPHNVMPLFNLVFNHEGYFWNGMIYPDNPNPQQRTLEDVVLMGIVAPHEMNSSPERTLVALKQNPTYPGLFKAAFGTPEITIENISKAIAQYLRSLISANSKFDRYLQGIETLTANELHGYVLFTTEEGADCFHCHGSSGTPLFTSNLFYNNALDAQCNDPRDRFAVTGQEHDRGAYRAPSLRNVEVTAPYMHDGRFETLDAVLQFYNMELVNSPWVHPLMHKIKQGGTLLTPSQIADLKAFLLTLTDEQFIGKTEK